MRNWIASLLLFGACHSSPPPATPVAAASQCPKVADHIVSLMSASKVVPDEQLDPFRRVITKHCDGDQWSSEAQHCMLAVQSLPEGDKCKPFLTPAQLDAFNDDPSVGQSKKSDDDGAAPTSGGGPTGGGGAVGGAAPPPAQSAPPAATRAPAPKSAPRKPTKAGDPCEGGE